MTPEILYRFTRFIQDYDKSISCSTVMTGKLPRHDYEK